MSTPISDGASASPFILPVAGEAGAPSTFGKVAARLRSRTLARNGLLARAEPARAELSLELLIEKSNLVPVWFLARGAECARAIAKIRAQGVAHTGAKGAWSGTGFLVSPSILLTNWHVLNTPEVAAQASVHLGYEYDVSGKLAEGTSFALNPERLFVANRELDFAFVWVDGEPGAHFAPISLARNAFAVAADECVNIVQHPNGRPKELALQENVVRHVGAEVIRYTTDTEPGSSGACVFNNRWMPVALHHASQREDDGTTLNEGIRLAAVAAYLERLLASDAASAAAARQLLGTFSGIDEAMGFFGALGRAPDVAAEDGLAVVRQSYAGEAYDVDVGVWQLDLGGAVDLSAVAEAMARMNLDIWAFVDAPRVAVVELVELLTTLYGVAFELSWAEAPADGGEAPRSVVLWNSRTVSGQARRWPRHLEANVGSNGDVPTSGGALPGLFEFRAVDRCGLAPYELVLVALAEGVGPSRSVSLERLVGAIDAASLELGSARDWLIAGALGAGDLAGALRTTHPTRVAPSAAAVAPGTGLVHWRGSCSCVDGLFVPVGSEWLSNDDRRCGVAGQGLPRNVQDLPGRPLVALRLSLADEETAVASDSEFIRRQKPEATDSVSGVPGEVH